MFFLWKKILRTFSCSGKKLRCLQRKWPELDIYFRSTNIYSTLKNSSNWLNLILHPNKTLVLIGLIIERSHFVSECLKLICDILSIRPSLGVAKFVISKITFLKNVPIRNANDCTEDFRLNAILCTNPPSPQENSEKGPLLLFFLRERGVYAQTT